MSQKLALPLNTCEINVGYKKTYAPGYNINGTSAIHYGVDFIGYTYANNYRFLQVVMVLFLELTILLSLMNSVEPFLNIL